MVCTRILLSPETKVVQKFQYRLQGLLNKQLTFIRNDFLTLHIFLLIGYINEMNGWQIILYMTFFR